MLSDESSLLETDLIESLLLSLRLRLVIIGLPGLKAILEPLVCCNGSCYLPGPRSGFSDLWALSDYSFSSFALEGIWNLIPSANSFASLRSADLRLLILNCRAYFRVIASISRCSRASCSESSISSISSSPSSLPSEMFSSNWILTRFTCCSDELYCLLPSDTSSLIF